MDRTKLRGVQGAVKRRKRGKAAFERGCIINATRVAARYFTAVLQDNYRKLQSAVAIVHQATGRWIDYGVKRSGWRL
jgi:hypothetical protein